MNERKDRCVNRRPPPQAPQARVPQGDAMTAAQGARGSKQGTQRHGRSLGPRAVPGRFWKGRRAGEVHPGNNANTCPPTPIHTRTHTGGHSLLAAARPVMGIYFRQLCALVPRLSSSAQCGRVNERLRNEGITCMGTARHLPPGCGAAATPGPESSCCGPSSLPRPSTHPTPWAPRLHVRSPPSCPRSPWPG